MSSFRLYAKRFFDGKTFSDQQVLVISNGKIIDIDQNIENVDVVAEGLIAPGFIDLQVNGGGGVLFNTNPSVASLKTMINAHAQFGTTAMLPTLITDEIEVMSHAADAVALAIAEKVPGILGIHFEGPHLSVAKKGAHSAEYIRSISDDEWQVLSRKDIGKVVVTLAPETVSLEDIRRMVKLGIKVCLGHSNADYKTAQAAVDAGADGFTHLFNAMSPLQGREPGVTGCALLNDSTYCGLIVDGHHVDYASCKLAVKTKSVNRIFLVTDAMPPVGTLDTEFAFFDRVVTLDSGKLTSTTGELAGSVLDMATAVKNTHIHMQIPLAETLCMASKTPYNYLYQTQNDVLLTVGSSADLVLLDDELKVQSTWIAGQQVFSNKLKL